MESHRDSEGDQPQSITEWRAAAQQDPEQAAAVLFARIATLGETQRRAVFAHLREPAQLAALMAEATRCGGPLAGVPYALKDLFDLKGTPTRAGSGFQVPVVPQAGSDAAIVGALAGRGAVCAAKTHLHEFAYGLTGENPFFGDVDNPAAPGTTSGGSSSGSAAAVAAGIVPFAIGTDTGGSVRVPAAWCGLFGMRTTPSHPWISDAFPLAPCCDTVGWFTRSAEDMKLLLATLVSSTPGRSGQSPRGLYLPWGRLDAAVARHCEQAARELCEVADGATQGLFENAFAPSAEAYSILTSLEAAALHAPWLDAKKAEYSSTVWGRVDRGRHWEETRIIRAASDREFLRGTLASCLQTFDFLVLPAVPCHPLPHAACAAFDRGRILDLTAPASLAGLPVLTLPLRDEAGRPVAGLQIIVAKADSPVLNWVLSRQAGG